MVVLKIGGIAGKKGIVPTNFLRLSRWGNILLLLCSLLLLLLHALLLGGKASQHLTKVLLRKGSGGSESSGKLGGSGRVHGWHGESHHGHGGCGGATGGAGHGHEGRHLEHNLAGTGRANVHGRRRSGWLLVSVGNWRRHGASHTGDLLSKGGSAGGGGHVGSPVNGHTSLGSSLKSAVQENAVVIGLLGDGVLLRNLVEVRLVLRISLLLLVDGRALHGLAQVRKSTKELLMVVGVAVLSGGDTTETPSVGLADKGTELGVLEELVQ